MPMSQRKAAKPTPRSKGWRWHHVPKQPAGGVAPCPVCRAVDVQDADVVILEAALPVLGCWPCVFGLAADAGKWRREQAQPPEPIPENVVRAADLLWTPEKARVQQTQARRRRPSRP